jgi:hypothetical protein
MDDKEWGKLNFPVASAVPCLTYSLTLMIEATYFSKT